MKKDKIKQEPYADGLRPANAKAPQHGASTIYVAANPANVRTIIDLTAHPRKFFSSDDFDRRVSARATKIAEARRRVTYGTADCPAPCGSLSAKEELSTNQTKRYLRSIEQKWEDCGRISVYDLTNPLTNPPCQGSTTPLLLSASGGPHFVFKRARDDTWTFKIPTSGNNNNYEKFTRPLRFKPYILRLPLRGLCYGPPPKSR